MAQSTNPVSDNARGLEVRFVRPKPSDPTGGLATLRLAVARMRERNARMARGLAIGFKRAEAENAVRKDDEK